MKKFYSLVIALFVTLAMHGQTFLSEDFGGGTMPPPGWTSLPIGSQWSVSQSSNAGGSSPEARFQGFAYTGTVRLITPAIDLTGVDTVILSFRHFADDNGVTGPAIGVATRAQSTWQSVWETNLNGNLGPEEIEVIIANEDVGSPYFQLSFYLTGNMASIDNWFLDDILLFAPSNFDCKMANILVPSQVNGPEPVAGQIKNLGYTVINEVNVSWESFSGIVRDSTFSGLELNLMETFDFEFDGLWASPFGPHDLTMWINSVNGLQDENQENDTLTKTIEYQAGSVPRRPCFEEFTSSTCGPCASFNASFVPWCSNHPDIVLVKYQMNWPGSGDPYYTAEGGARRTYYGLNAVPYLYCNGANVSTNISSVQSAYDNALTKTSPYEIASSFTITGTTINITTNILPYQSTGSKQVHNIVIEEVTTGNVGSNGETEFHHVMMKMFPDASGESVNFQGLQPVSRTFSYDLSQTNVEEYDDLLVAVIIQDESSKEILQSDYGMQDAYYSSEARLSEITLDGVLIEGFDPDIYEYDIVLPEGTTEAPIVDGETIDDGAMSLISQAFELPGDAVIDVFAENLATTRRYIVHFTIFTGVDEQDDPNIQIYPNPAKNQVYVMGAKNVSVTIWSIDGKQVLSLGAYNGGAIDLSNLNNGIYFLNVMNEKGILARKKIIVM